LRKVKHTYDIVVEFWKAVYISRFLSG